MISGVDTTFLVELEVLESPRHQEARRFLQREILDGEHRLALAPQVLFEFVHVVTDARRFERPATMTEALERAQAWWRAREVRQVFPGTDSTELSLEWMRTHKLGRKRLLDTQLGGDLLRRGDRPDHQQQRPRFLGVRLLHGCPAVERVTASA